MRIPLKALSLIVIVFILFSGPIILAIGLKIYTQSLVEQLIFDIAFLVCLFAICRLLNTISGKLGIAFGTSILAILLLIRVTEISVLYQFSTGFNDSFFVHLDPVSLEIAMKDYPAFALLAAFMFTLLPIILYKMFKGFIPDLPSYFSIPALVTSMLMLVFLTYPFNNVSQYSPAARFVSQAQVFFTYQPVSIEFENRLVKQLDIETKYSKRFSATRKENSKNLILVYLESFDLSFTDFGNSKYQGLTPNLDKFITENTVLEQHHSSETFTLAGIISSLCGFTPEMRRGNDSLFGTSHFQNVTCLPDILSKLNYEQVYFGGANKAFAGKGDFLYAHQYDEVNGFGDLQHKYDNHASWGLYDTSLFNEAFERIKELDARKRPFNVTLLTLNTHIPGVRSVNCPKYRGHDNQFLHAVHCTDHDLGVFIEKLEKDNLLDNTVLVITADHYVFRTRKLKKLFGDQLQDQRIVAAIQSPNNSLPKAIGNTATYDLAPTILDLLNVEHNASFLLGKSGLSRHTPDNRKRTVIDRHNPRLATVSDCETMPQLDALCKTKLTLAIQDYMVERANNTTFNDESMACDNWVGIKVRASNESNWPSEVILRGKDMLDHVSEKGWPINRNNRHGVFFLSFRNDGSADDLLFFDAKKGGAAQRLRENLIRTRDKQLGILLSTGNASTLFDQESIQLLQQAGINKAHKFQSGKPFVLFFLKQNEVRYVDFHSVTNRFVEREFSKDNCVALIGENEKVAAN